MYISVKELPACLTSALKSAGYGATDILVVAQSRVDSAAYASDGQRGFVTIVNLDSGQTHTETGSWGGSNMFTATLADDSRDPIDIPINGAVIKGSRGYPRTFATIYVHPDAWRFLPSGEEEELSAAAQQALYCFGAIKGGEYRRDEMSRRKVSAADVDALVESGHLKRSKNGATQITTKGKNARTIRN